MDPHWENLIAPVVGAFDFELWGVEYDAGRRRAQLCVYIDSPRGVSAADCGRVSAQLSSVLKAEQVFAGPYVLEVSSPGMERRFFKAEQFARFVGQDLRLKLCSPQKGRSRYRGCLETVGAESLSLRVDGEKEEFLFSEIDNARLVCSTLDTQRQGVAG